MFRPKNNFLLSGILLLLQACAQNPHYQKEKTYELFPNAQLRQQRPYATARLDSLMVHDTGNNYFGPYKLPDPIFRSLSMLEKLSYTLRHPESYRQICSLYLQENESGRSSIRLQLPSLGEQRPSLRQLDALAEHRDSLVLLVTADLKANAGNDLEMLDLIRSLDLYETIPVLIQKQKKGTAEDNYILTVLMEMMQDAETPWKPFVESNQFAKWAASSARRGNFIPYSEEDAGFIMMTADRYFQSKSSK